MTTPFVGVVALDGPSGTGKSTVARGLAARLDARYLDTGAMYRAATAAVLGANVAPDDADAVAGVVERTDIRLDTAPAGIGVRLGGADVTALIRRPEVTAAVSAVSAIPAVRTRLVAQQRQIISAVVADGAGIVVEGRDIASVVWPDAAPKVYLTAREDVRAARRAAELVDGSSVAAVAEDLRRRDRLDSSRVTAPLVRADGAVELDTSELDVDQVVRHLVQLVRTVRRAPARQP